MTIARAAMSLTYPADFMLIGAMNPCPCGHLGDSHMECQCTPMQVQQYRSKISGPLLDRIDIHCEVPAVRFRELSGERSGESSREIKKRVDRARRAQAERFTGAGIHSNSQLPSRLMKKYCSLKGEASRLIEMAVERLGFSARAYTRVLKVARTIADLEGSHDIEAAHVSEAVQYRSLDRQLV